MANCHYCKSEIDGNPTVDVDTGAEYCDIACALAEETGRPKVVFKSDAAIPDFEELDIVEP